MRDPDLVGRAQRAAIELERAWDRWRTMHGLGREPMPAVSSYVGYSLEEPWGQPRVVFGIEAREAEQLAALLDRHDCAGPVYAGLASMPSARTEESPEFLTATDRRRVIVPAQSQGGVAEREAAWREATWRDPVPRERTIEPALPQQYRVAERPAQQAASERAAVEDAEAAADAAEEPEEERAEQDAQGLGGGEPPLAAFRPNTGPEAQVGEDDEYAEDDEAPVPDEPVQPEEPSEGGTRWRRAGRLPRGHAVPRQKRGSGASRGAGAREEG
jgi:hypothetical protein